MADSGGNTVVVRFIGDDRSLAAALRRLETDTRRADDSTKKLGSNSDKSFGMLSKAAGLAQSGLSKLLSTFEKMAEIGHVMGAVNGAVGALQQLSGILLLAPAAVGVLGAMFATLKIGFIGFGDAVTKGGDALQKLAPSARATAEAVRGLSPEFQKLKNAVQDRLFTGFAKDVKSVAAVYFPILRSYLPQLAAWFNVMGHNAAKALTAPAARNSIIEVLVNTQKMLARMPHSLSGLITGFLTLAGAGSKYLVPLGAFIDRLAVKFAHWADGFVNSGKFDAAVKQAEAGFRNLWAAGKNVLDIIVQVGASLASGMMFSDIEHGGGAGGGPLQFLRDMTGALRDFFKEAQSKDALFALGRAFADIAGQGAGVLLDLLRNIRPIIIALQPIVSTLADVIGTTLRSAFDQLGPPIAKFIQTYGPSISNVLQDIGRFIRNDVIPPISDFITFLNTHKQQVKEFFDGLGVALKLIGVGIAILAVPLAKIVIDLGLFMIWISHAKDAVIDACRYIIQVFLGMTAAVLGGIGMLLHGLAQIPGPFGQAMGAAAQRVDGATNSVLNLSRSIDGVKPKDVRVTQNGAQDATGNVAKLKQWLDALPRIKQVTIQVTQTVTQNVVRLFSTPFGRAAGGPVMAGHTYLVGERGPELVTMGSAGYVTPNHKLGGQGGGGGGGATVTFMGNTSDALATVIMGMIRTGQIQIRA